MGLAWKEQAFNITIINSKFLIIKCKMDLIRVYLIVIKIRFKILAMLWVKNGVMDIRMMFLWISNFQLLLELEIVITIHLNFLFSKANNLYINILLKGKIAKISRWILLWIKIIIWILCEQHRVNRMTAQIINCLNILKVRTWKCTLRNANWGQKLKQK